jgi:uncharacterized protein (DUF885 family)
VKRFAPFLLALLVAATTMGTTNDPSASTVDQLAEGYWQYELQTDYGLRAQVGLPVETIRAVSVEEADKDAAEAQAVLDGLAAVDAAKLDHGHWLTFRTLSFLASNVVANRKYFWLAQQATPYAGGGQLGTITTLLTNFRFADAADGRRYVSLLRQYAAFVRSLLTFLQGQHERGIVLPNVESEAAAAVFRGYAAPAQSAVLVPVESRLTSLAGADRAFVEKGSADAVTSEIVPAFQSVAAYLEAPYRAGAPSGVGLGQYPGGREYYQYLVEAYTTLTVTPEKLHAMGLAEVDRLNAQLDEIRRQAGFTGSLTEFKRYLATDRQFFPKTPEEFGERLEIYVERSAAAAPRFFLHMPAAPYGVAPLPKALAGSQTFGYYDAPTAEKPKGTYLYNAWHPERTSMLTAGALICHELIPGHHFQIALQQENTTLPNVRRYDFSETGFVEGWGEYASQLCWNMGVYETPYDKAGRIMQDLMVTTRLVVDTGMNVLGWSRDRAMAYMRENLTLTEPQIESETLRYSTDIPGQALAYKTGELTMLEIRAEAQRRLGSSFDIRRFHSWVIDSGTMTLDTLRAHVDYEIALTSSS